MRNEEKTYDYKGLLITAMAWSVGMGLRTRNRGHSGCLGCSTHYAPYAGAGHVGTAWRISRCMVPCTALVRGPAAVSVGSTLSLTLSSSYTALWKLETRAAIFVPTVAVSLIVSLILALSLSR